MAVIQLRKSESCGKSELGYSFIDMCLKGWKGPRTGDAQALKEIGIYFNDEPTNRAQRRKAKGMAPLKEYKKFQIIKHALEYYVQRVGGDPKDLHTEKLVLSEITDEVNRLKEEYGIKSKKGGSL